LGEAANLPPATSTKFFDDGRGGPTIDKAKTEASRIHNKVTPISFGFPPHFLFYS
jgi:hypothetical protein